VQQRGAGRRSQVRRRRRGSAAAAAAAALLLLLLLLLLPGCASRRLGCLRLLLLLLLVLAVAVAGRAGRAAAAPRHAPRLVAFPRGVALAAARVVRLQLALARAVHSLRSTAPQRGRARASAASQQRRGGRRSLRGLASSRAPAAVCPLQVFTPHALLRFRRWCQRTTACRAPARRAAAPARAHLELRQRLQPAHARL
jgi:hypothetical protein